MRTYIFRADGNALIGAGHLMRCLTVADALKQKLKSEERILFFCAMQESAQVVAERGYQAEALQTDYQQMDLEIPVLEEYISESALQGNEIVFLVDSYYVTASYLEALHRFGKVALLDDLCQKEYPVDLLINYNLFASEDSYQKLYQSFKPRFALGGRYVPIGKAFAQKQFQVKDSVKKVLITTGGGDQDNIGGEILQALKQMTPDISFTLVAGKFNPHLEELQTYGKSVDGVEICYDVKDMASLMEKQDICITAGGTTVYEMAAVGVPMICFSYAENQEALVRFIGDNDIAKSAGAWHLDKASTMQMLQEAYRELVEHQEARRDLYLKEREIVDAKGANRLADCLAEL